MASLETIRRLTLIAQTEGYEEAQSKLQALAKSEEAVAVASTNTEKASAGLTRQWENALNRADPLRKAVTDYEKALNLSNRAVAQGIGSVEQQAKVLERYQEAVLRASAGNGELRVQSGLATGEINRLASSTRQAAVSLATGESPFTVLTRQGAQMGQVLSQSNVGMRQFASEVTSGLGQVFTIGRVAFGGIVAGAVAGALALSQYNDAQRAVHASLAGLGRASGATADDINRIAAESARAGNISVSSAREMASALAQTGKIGVESFAGIIAVSRDFATITGQDLPAAQKELAEAFADPIQGMETLQNRLELLDGRTQGYIRTLVSAGQTEQARLVMQQALQGVIASTDQKVLNSIGVWERLKTAMGGGWNALGRGLSGPTNEDILANLMQQREAAGGDNAGTIQAQRRIARLDVEIAKAWELVDAERALARARKEQQDINRATVRGDEVTRGVFQEITAYDALTTQITALNKALEHKSQLTNSLATQQARDNLMSQQSAMNPVAGDPNANRAALMRQDYENQLAAIKAVTVAQQADAAATIARTAALREGKGEMIANVAAEQARGQVMQSYISGLDKHIQQQGAAISAQRALNSAVEQGSMSVTQAAQAMSGEVAHRQRLVEMMAIEAELSKKVQEANKAEGAEKRRLAREVAELADRKHHLGVLDQRASQQDREMMSGQRVASGNQAIQSMQQQIQQSQLQLQNIGANLMDKAMSEARLMGSQQIMNLGLDVRNAAEKKVADRIMETAEALGRMKGAADVAAAAFGIMRGQMAEGENVALELARAQGMSTAEYIRSAEALKAEQQIRNAGIPGYSAQAQAIRSNAAALAELKIELDNAKNSTMGFTSMLGIIQRSAASGGGGGGGVPMSNGTFTTDWDPTGGVALKREMDAILTAQLSRQQNASRASAGTAVANPLNSLLASAQSRMQQAVNDNGNKIMPQMDAYAERNASVYYGTESGNYYTEGMESGTEKLLAAAQKEYEELVRIANLANQLVAQGMNPQQVASTIAAELNKIGFAASAQAMLDAAKIWQQQQSIASTKFQLSMPAGSSGVSNPNYVKPGTWDVNPFAAPLQDNFTGFYADGGKIPSGKIGIAGEAGPEVIHGPATVIPMEKLGGGANQRPIQVIQNITMHITTNDGRKLVRGVTSQATQNLAVRSMIAGSSAA